MIWQRILISLFCALSIIGVTNSWASEPREIEWTELHPPVDPTLKERFARKEIDIAEVRKIFKEWSFTGVPELNGEYVRIPGYLVPLGADDNNMAHEFLLVPTQGACIHVPPPPPNQIVHVTFAKGLAFVEAGYTPYWVIGTLKVGQISTELTEAMYSMSADEIELYRLDIE